MQMRASATIFTCYLCVAPDRYRYACDTSNWQYCLALRSGVQVSMHMMFIAHLRTVAVIRRRQVLPSLGDRD